MACDEPIPAVTRRNVKVVVGQFRIAGQSRKSKYIPWAELLHRTFGFEIVCAKCHALLRLIALVKNQDVAKKILTAMHLPTEVPELHPARPPPPAEREARDAEDWLN